MFPTKQFFLPNFFFTILFFNQTFFSNKHFFQANIFFNQYFSIFFVNQNFLSTKLFSTNFSFDPTNFLTIFFQPQIFFDQFFFDLTQIAFNDIIVRTHLIIIFIGRNSKCGSAQPSLWFYNFVSFPAIKDCLTYNSLKKNAVHPFSLYMWSDHLLRRSGTLISATQLLPACTVIYTGRDSLLPSSVPAPASAWLS